MNTAQFTISLIIGSAIATAAGFLLGGLLF